jgi:hypothetical protein
VANGVGRHACGSARDGSQVPDRYGELVLVDEFDGTVDQMDVAREPASAWYVETTTAMTGEEFSGYWAGSGRHGTEAGRWGARQIAHRDDGY